MDIRSMQRDQEDAAASLLAQALLDDPGWSIVCPDSETRRTVLYNLSREAMKMCAAAGGETSIAWSESNKMLGVLVWNPPEQNASIPASTYITGMMRSLPQAIRHPRVAVRCVRNLLALDSIKPKHELYYAAFLGCSVRGRGVGRHLMNHLFEQSKGQDVYLETQNPDNLHFYQRLGFSSYGTIDQTYPNGPRCFGLLRSRSAKSSSKIEFAPEDKKLLV